MTKKCPNCGAEVEMKIDRCPHCGYDFANGNKGAANELGLAGLTEASDQLEETKVKKQADKPIVPKKKAAKTSKNENKPAPSKSSSVKPAPSKNNKKSSIKTQPKRKHKFTWLLFPITILVLVSVYMGVSSQHLPHKQHASSTVKVQKKKPKNKRSKRKKSQLKLRENS